MSASWVAGTVRARALARRRLGAGGARALAASPDLASAVRALADTPYGHDVRPGQDLAAAQRAVTDALLWNLRVLAGWLPREGSAALRVLAGWFEVANLDEHLARLAGEPAEPPYVLGALDTSWRRIAATGSPGAVADVLARSPWRVRGVAGPQDLRVGIRLGWAEVALSTVPESAPWARGGVALLVLSELAAAGRALAPATAARTTRLLGPAFLAAVPAGTTEVGRAQAALPRDAAWVLDGVDRLEDLWRGEQLWWRRLERDGFALLGRTGFGRAPVVGAVAVLAADARRTRAALETAAYGAAALEVFDALA